MSSSTNPRLLICKNSSNKNIKRTLYDSSNIMVQNKKKMQNKSCQSKKPFAQIFSEKNFNISKEVTITPVHNTKNDIISVLKKLPQITFHCVQPKPDFKFPKVVPIKKDILSKKVITPKPKVVHKKKNVLSERQENYEQLRKMNSSPKQKQKIMQNNIRIKIFENSTELSEVKTKSNNDSNINKITCDQGAKTDEHIKGNYALLDISTKGQHHIVYQNNPPDFIIDGIPMYDQFVLGIVKSRKETNYQSDDSQSLFEKELFAGPKPTFSPEFSNGNKMSSELK